jgi:hypothetical protein
MNTDHLPKPKVQSTQMLEDLARGLLRNERMSDYSREMFELAAHQLADRIRLFMQGMSMDRMARLPSLMSTVGLYVEYLRDPERMKALWEDEPKTFLSALKLLHDISKAEYSSLREDIRGTEEDSKAGFDPKKQYNVLFNLVAASNSQLPESLKDQKEMREFRQVAQSFIDVFIKGEDIPDPPERQTRILDSDVIDVGEDEPSE